MAKCTATATADVRFSFTAQFLCASAIFARRCVQIEGAHPDNPDDATRTEHLGLVTAVIMQCAAAVEAESAELTEYGPGSHLGSDRTDRITQNFLKPLTDFIDGQDALTRYKLILHLLNKPPLVEGEQPWQDMNVLVRLRNELVHFKSKFSKKMEGQKLYKTLQQLRLAKPPFVAAQSLFFPHKLLGAACAAWAIRTAVAFLNGFYGRLGIESSLRRFMSRFDGL